MVQQNGSDKDSKHFIEGQDNVSVALIAATLHKNTPDLLYCI